MRVYNQDLRANLEIVRRELRLTDNPILHHISELHSKDQAPFSHLLPVYVFPARQVEVGGFLDPATATCHSAKTDEPSSRCTDRLPEFPTTIESPYPPARSVVAGFPRCGPHRARFWTESVWEFKNGLESIGSGLAIRVGRIDDILENMLHEFKRESAVKREVVGVWITAEDGVAEKTDERNVFRVAGLKKIPVRVWKDEKYLIDDRDLPYMTPKEVPDSFAEFRKTAACLRTASRKTLPRPASLPPLPGRIPAQPIPFRVPTTLDGWIAGLLKPLYDTPVAAIIPPWPLTAVPQHADLGGEAYALERLKHLIASGATTTYRYPHLSSHGEDRRTKLTAWLALGCITARQINEHLLDFEEGRTALGHHADGYGIGENGGTASIRAELLWRDYLRLCTRKYGCKLFRLEGFKGDMDRAWKHGDDPDVNRQIQRFVEGRTGVPVVDTALREMSSTGYTSDHARQIAATYFGRQLGIDWRIGAEWFEYCLVDYDVSGNWGHWQYWAGVGNDPVGYLNLGRKREGNEEQEDCLKARLDADNLVTLQSNRREMQRTLY
ncbi:Cryptochrome-1 [Drechslerella dactyloides]|uniref:Cryptochrome DASH n=1 Tax=Drechslerella dactyloides TaxID=74499 RepID=A0AAD6IX68_DREDA|nr:Cryptochrome-1 [Drechslerella dactyloides]